MKSLEKALEDYEKAKERMEASKARYEADVKRFRKAESDKTEAENMEIVRVIREWNVPISELASFRMHMETELPGRAAPIKEDTENDDEFSKDERKETKEEEGR